MHVDPRFRSHLRLVFLALFVVSAALPAAAQQITVWKSGNTVNATISASLTGTRCCLGLSFDSPFGGAECSVPCPESPVTKSWYCNSVGDHTVAGCWLGSETGYAYQCSTQTVTIDPAEQAQPSPSCPLFDLLAGAKVLTHLYDSHDVYPYLQVQDAQMPITIKARRAAPGSMIYLRVLDPPDPSTYGGPYIGNDNYDTAGYAGMIDGLKELQTLLPPSGESTTLTLTTTTYAAGDNYEVRGSTDPNYLSDPNFQCTDCPDSGVITAWKRVYLETDKMFRTGALLTANAPAGATQISVSSVAGFIAPKGKTPGSKVVMVHAPETAGGPIYFEPAPGDAPLKVASVNSNKRQITLSRPLTHSYSTASDPNLPWLSDGVGVVTGNATDFYSTNTSFIAGLLAPAFVEVVTIPASTDPGYVPYYPNFTNPGEADLIDDGLRWFRNWGQPNRFCSFGGSYSGAGLGNRPSGKRFAWTWVGKVESLVSSSSRSNLNGEATAHEMTHTWDVNQNFNNGGHCSNTYDYLMPTFLCLMRPGNDWFDSTGTVVKPEYYDGRVMYHYDTSALDRSEYLTIRLHPEPLQ